MKTNTLFKTIFCLITAVILGLLCFLAVQIAQIISEDPEFPLLFIFVYILIFLIIFAIYGSIAIFVYKDAPKRGMNRWMWMTIATFVPNFIGIIIYFIVRSNSASRCPHCGKGIRTDFDVCPYCSCQLNLHCRQCGKQVQADWKVCPYCKNDQLLDS